MHRDLGGSSRQTCYEIVASGPAFGMAMPRGRPSLIAPVERTCSSLSCAPLAAYVGVYESPEWGRVEIVEAGRTLLVTCGVMRALAEPLGKPDTVWLELEPGEGGVLQFEGSGTAPDSLYFDGRRFHRGP